MSVILTLGALIGALHQAKTNVGQTRTACLRGREVSARKRKEQEPVSGLSSVNQNAHRMNSVMVNTGAEPPSNVTSTPIVTQKRGNCVKSQTGSRPVCFPSVCWGWINVERAGSVRRRIQANQFVRRLETQTSALKQTSVCLVVPEMMCVHPCTNVRPFLNASLTQ